MTAIEPLLEEVTREDSLRTDDPGVEAAREWRERDLARLNRGVRRLVEPGVFSVVLTAKLWNLKENLLRRMNIHRNSH